MPAAAAAAAAAAATAAAAAAEAAAAAARPAAAAATAAATAATEAAAAAAAYAHGATGHGATGHAAAQYSVLEVPILVSMIRRPTESSEYGVVRLPARSDRRVPGGLDRYRQRAVAEYPRMSVLLTSYALYSRRAAGYGLAGRRSRSALRRRSSS